jgi:hypothetical protein
MPLKTPAPGASRHAKPPKTERRRAVRYRCLRDCIIRLEGATPGVGDWCGMTYDLSTRGIGVALLYPLTVGTVLVVEKFGRSSAPVLRGRVVRSVPLGFLWLHGCELIQPMGEEELQDWLR